MANANEKFWIELGLDDKSLKAGIERSVKLLKNLEKANEILELLRAHESKEQVAEFNKPQPREDNLRILTLAIRIIERNLDSWQRDLDSRRQSSERGH